MLRSHPCSRARIPCGGTACRRRREWSGAWAPRIAASLLPSFGECIPISVFTTIRFSVSNMPFVRHPAQRGWSGACHWRRIRMMFEKLTFRSVAVRSVLVPLRRPVVSRVGLFDQWPIILIDLLTEEGIVGRSYLEPYLKHSARYIAPAICDLAEARKGHAVRPIEDFQNGRRALNLIGYEGVSMIAVSGLDMAAWDALAKAAGMPLAVLLGGSTRPVPAYNSSGLWLTEVAGLGDDARALVAEGGFKGLKLRLGRDRLADDLAAIEAVRAAVGADIKLMVDFNQGLSLGDALRRCHALDGQGLYWFEEPITYDNLAGYAQLSRELTTPVQLGENFYGPRALHQALSMDAGDYVMAHLIRMVA